MVAPKFRCTSFMSCRLAPSTPPARGIPRPSVSRLRLVPLLPRSVGLGPVPFSPQRSFGHRSGGPPLLKPEMYRAGRAEASGQGLPLAARALNTVDSVHTLASGDIRAPTLGMRPLRRQQGQNTFPQSVWNTPSFVYAIPRCRVAHHTPPHTLERGITKILNSVQGYWIGSKRSP